MKVAYYLNEGRKKNLYCRISDGAERVSFSLGYTINPSSWNAKQEEGPNDDPYYYTLMSFKAYLVRRYHELKSVEIPASNILATLKQEADTFVDGSGIEGIARKMFDDRNKDNHIPTYDQFIQAFEKYSGLERTQYKARPIDNIIHFYPENGEVLEMDTHEGMSTRLRDMIERKSYSEIATETNDAAWSDIYTDSAINKQMFLPKLSREWLYYWNTTYIEIHRRVGKTDHLNNMKEDSWRQFQVFMECFDGVEDIIELALDIDDSCLYPLVVITMFDIYTAQICCEEYCQYEFSEEEWERISLSNEKEDGENEEGEEQVKTSPLFYVKPAEFY